MEVVGVWVGVRLTGTALQGTLSAPSMASVSVTLTNQEDRAVGDRVEVEEEVREVQGMEEVPPMVTHMVTPIVTPMVTPMSLATQIVPPMVIPMFTPMVIPMVTPIFTPMVTPMPLTHQMVPSMVTPLEKVEEVEDLV